MKQIWETLYIDWIDVFMMINWVWNNNPTIIEFNCCMEDYHRISFNKVDDLVFYHRFGARSRWDITVIQYNNLFNPSSRAGKWLAFFAGKIAYRFRKKPTI